MRLPPSPVLWPEGLSPITFPGDGGKNLSKHVAHILSFYINLPIGAVTMVMIAWLLPVPARRYIPLRQKLGEIDYLGGIFLITYFSGFSF
jgi:hypothetical protein